MILLAAELIDARVQTLDDKQPSSLAKALSFVQGRRGDSTEKEGCLLVCAGPSDLAKLLTIADWRKRFGMVGAWIIDSFWTDHIPRSLSLAKLFDVFFVTSLEDVDTWRQASGVPTVWLPWGTDGLRLGSAPAERNWDITRVGRQPPEWENDDVAAQAAADLGVKYRSRPASNGMNTLQNQQMMMAVYADTKYVLAFSNAVNPEPYTHPTRQYLTGRWVDGLAGGAVLAGISPKGLGVEPLLWPGATFDFESVQLAEGLRSLSGELPKWTPQRAVRNYVMALKKLDWRWRFKILADNFGLKPVLLTNELKSLESKIAGLAVEAVD